METLPILADSRRISSEPEEESAQSGVQPASPFYVQSRRFSDLQNYPQIYKKPSTSPPAWCSSPIQATPLLSYSFCFKLKYILTLIQFHIYTPNKGHEIRSTLPKLKRQITLAQSVKSMKTTSCPANVLTCADS